MKSFKVIREYPYGLPVGSIVKEGQNGEFYYNNKNKLGHNPSHFPWIYEEINSAEKDYIVLEYKSNDTGLIHSLIDSGLYLPNNLPECELFGNKYVFINKIKRTSDGAVFEIGDKFTFNGIGRLHDTIKGFTFRQCGEIAVNYGNGKVAVKKISKVNNTPIFKSHDGKDMYIGDKYCWVYLSDNDSRMKPYTVISNDKCVVSHGMGYKNQYAVFFSNENSAKAWIELNRPRYSIENLREAIVFKVNANTCEGKFKQLYAIDPEKIEGFLYFKSK